MDSGGSIVSRFEAQGFFSNSSRTWISATSVFGQFGAPREAASCAAGTTIIALNRTAATRNQKRRLNYISPGLCQHTDISRGEPD
ncbi:hypothetical protein ACN47E_007446 [Coniothyrium glycines]